MSFRMHGRVDARHARMLQNAVIACDLDNAAGVSEEAKEELRAYIHSWIEKPLKQVVVELRRQTDERSKKSDGAES